MNGEVEKFSLSDKSKQLTSLLQDISKGTENLL